MFNRRWNMVLASCVAATLAIAAGCGAEQQRDSNDTRRAAAPKVAVVDSLTRLRADDDVEYSQRPEITLDLARGETESVQVVVDDAAKGTISVDIERPNGGNRGAARVSAQLYHAQPITVTSPSPGGMAGTYFDALLPLGNEGTFAAHSRRAVLWIDVAAPRTAGGRHEGSVAIRTRGGNDVTIPLTVQVHDIAMPRNMSLESSIGLDASQIERFENVDEGTAEFAAMLQRYVAELGNAHLNAADLSTPPEMGDGASWLASDSGKEYANNLRAFGGSGVRLPMYRTYPFADPTGADRSEAVDYLRGAQSVLTQLGHTTDTYAYIVDEPGANDNGDIRAFGDLVREGAPGTRHLVTAEPRAAVDDVVDIWAVNIGPPTQRTPASSLERGDDLWWYPSISSHPPFPTLFIDDSRPSPRALGALMWAHNVKGLLYWSATHWHEVSDPWSDAATYNDPSGAVGNGDGVLLYPGEPMGLDGPAPSIRLKQLRDAVEDYELLRANEGTAEIGLPNIFPREAAAARTLLQGVRRSLFARTNEPVDVIIS